MGAVCGVRLAPGGCRGGRGPVWRAGGVSWVPSPRATWASAINSVVAASNLARPETSPRRMATRSSGSTGSTRSKRRASRRVGVGCWGASGGACTGHSTTTLAGHPVARALVLSSPRQSARNEHGGTRTDMTTPTPIMLRPIDAATVLGVSSNTLAAWRHQGTGPAYIRISARMVAYRPADLHAWADARRVADGPISPTPRLHGGPDGSESRPGRSGSK